MASSSRPFQSQAMSRMVRLYHRLIAAGGRWMRHCRTAVSLWTQVAVYPAYAIFQASRVVLRQLRAVTVQVRERLALGAGAAESSPTATVLEPDWGIQQLLAALVPPQAAALVLKADAAGLQRYVTDQQFDQGAFALSALQLSDQQLPATTKICGIASQVSNRTLVLVGANNQILDVLSAAQQAAIADAMAYLMAGYYYWLKQRQRRYRLQGGPLPLPQANQHTWWPVRQFLKLMAWMQVGSVAIATNLFQETDQPWIHRRPQLPTAPDETLQLPAPRVITSLATWFRHRWQWFWSGTALPSTVTKTEAEPLALELGTASATLTPQLEPTSRVLSDALNVASSTQSAVIGHSHLSQTATTTPTWEATWDGATDWVDVQVAAVEYVDHPLVAILRWIDRGLLWLEQIWQRGWQWLRSQWQNRPNE